MDRSSTSFFPSERPAGERRRILVVEDNEADLFLMREAIERARIHADVEVLQDGHAAAAYFEAADAAAPGTAPDLVVLDLNLPKRGGDEVLERVRRSRCCRGAIVLIATSSNSARDREAARALGADAYFIKPSDYDEFMKLGELVRSLLQQGRRDPEEAP